MKPTDILMEEHRVIEQVLAVLERMAAQAREKGALDPEHATDAVEFFRNFADRRHHMKEETHLFTKMEARGFPREGGPTGVMLYEHEQGRAHVRAMAELIMASAAGEPGASKRWAEHAHAYIGLLRQHIEKEDHCLFAMANQALTEQDQEELAELFEQAEQEELGRGAHERYFKIANDLAETYGVPKAAASSRGCGCGCSHSHSEAPQDQPQKKHEAA
jgi:hemerythrin-like domain-containing protein